MVQQRALKRRWTLKLVILVIRYFFGVEVLHFLEEAGFAVASLLLRFVANSYLQVFGVYRFEALVLDRDLRLRRVEHLNCLVHQVAAIIGLGLIVILFLKRAAG